MGRITLPQPVSSWLLTLLALSFAVAVLVLLFVGTYTRDESAQGQLISSPGLLPVIARSPSTVTAMRVQEGQAVTKDQVLVELSAEANEARRAIVLRAPESGVIANLVVRNQQAVTAGQRLLSILPQGSLLEAELWLPSRAIGFLETGKRVTLRYHAFPYQKFGQQGGRVREISQSAIAAPELTGLLGRTITEPLFRVLVQLDRQTVSAYGRAEPLKPGMTVDADILLDKRRLIEWVLEPLYGISRVGPEPISTNPRDNTTP